MNREATAHLWISQDFQRILNTRIPCYDHIMERSLHKFAKMYQIYWIPRHDISGRERKVSHSTPLKQF